MPTTRALSTVACALALCLAGQAATAQTPADVGIDVIEHRLPLDRAGRVAIADLVAILVEQIGPRIQITSDTIPGHVGVADLDGQLTLAGLTMLLGPVGVTFHTEPTTLTVRIDRVILGGHMDRLEAALRELLGDRAPVYTLEHLPAPLPGGYPVVLIHGLDSSAEALRGAGSALARDGYDVHLLHYPDDGRVEVTAAALGHLLRGLHADRQQRIALVTTSMGGLIARTYVELDADYAGEVSHLIACGPPNNGSKLARFHHLAEIAETFGDMLGDQGLDGFFVFDGLGQAATDLAPGSLLLTRLNGAKRAPATRYSILAGDGDVLHQGAFAALLLTIEALRQRASANERLLLDTLTDIASTAQAVSGPHGDGAVTLASQTLAGVADRVVLPLHHLEYLAGDVEPIPALAEVRSRLP